MTSNVTTQGQEAVECKSCRKPVSFFCRHCGINLCDPCVLLHLRVKSRFGHDVVDYASKDDDECSSFFKTICEYKSQNLSELSVKVEDVLKIIAKENGQLQSFRHKLETSLDQLQKCFRREVEEKKKGLMKRFLKNKYISFFLFTLFYYFLFISPNSKGWISTCKIDENDMQNYFGNVEKMLESKLSKLEKSFISDQGFPTAEIKIDEKDMHNYFGNIEKMLESKFSVIEKRFIPDPESPTAEIKINENDMQNYFANIEKMLETKLSKLEKSFIPDQGFPTTEIKIDEKDMHNYFASIEKMLESKLSKLEKRFIPDQGSPTAEIKINENDMQNYFANIEKMLETKFSSFKKRLVPDPDSGRKVLEVPTVSSVIDTGLSSSVINRFGNKYFSLKDMVVTDDQKVWVGGYNNELKLFDLKGNLHRTVNIWIGNHICMYKKQLLFSAWIQNSVKKISDDDTVVTMFTTGDWEPYGITESAFGDLLVCLRKGDQSKVVRYNSTGTVLQEIQYVSHSQPLYRKAWYIAENNNLDIIVTYFAKKKVIAVDILGKFRYIYPGRNSDIYAGSVATDSVGHVYITDYSDDKIHMLDRDGRFLRYIIPEGGLKFPNAICMIGDSEMIVGEQHTGLVKRIRIVE